MKHMKPMIREARFPSQIESEAFMKNILDCDGMIPRAIYGGAILVYRRMVGVYELWDKETAKKPPCGILLRYDEPKPGDAPTPRYDNLLIGFITDFSCKDRVEMYEVTFCTDYFHDGRDCYVAKHDLPFRVEEGLHKKRLHTRVLRECYEPEYKGQWVSAVLYASEAEVVAISYITFQLMQDFFTKEERETYEDFIENWDECGSCRIVFKKTGVRSLENILITYDPKISARTVTRPGNIRFEIPDPYEC